MHGPPVTTLFPYTTLFRSINRGDVLFIDEIHRLNPKVEEFLYPAMEDFVIDFGTGKGPSATNLRIPLKAFTLLGATRSEEHTSELQSQSNLVCRLLREKKE